MTKIIITKRFRGFHYFHKDRWTVKDVRNNPRYTFLFGDNLQRTGKGGQAIIRDEPNAVGIPTKIYPARNPTAYFSDDNFEQNKTAINKAFLGIPEYDSIIISTNGLGTGLADLQNKAPQTWRHLQSILYDIRTRLRVQIEM